MSLRQIIYVYKPPKGVLKRKGPKFKQQCAITSKRYEIGCELLLITDKKYGLSIGTYFGDLE